ncbi:MULTISPECIES: DUF202 domain-containing protein [Crossiella]|uniref:Putative membrane protein n=1 Tax=Crossiella cryophila TaxID=43355 RepID=A0A7W7FT00_9PSEU|nr:MULTISPECIES: DUF202 domain-containing protein [Crossiella]MBB4675923.1 putative membrane protein [Crossiella cryophila]MCK2243970.1 DUF202 domain-containing protein [Crossiella sp. S99.2]MCK2257172.1 DUF202 domain-containing protein [Crossiella sp. S99.1]
MIDPGLQPERTVLAWRRTLLAFLGAALVLLRLAAHRSPLLAAGIVLVAGPVAALVSLDLRRRYRRVRADLPGSASRWDGRLPLWTSLFAGLLGLGALLYVLSAPR